MKELAPHEENYTLQTTQLDMKTLFKRIRRRLDGANYNSKIKATRAARPYEVIRMFNLMQWRCVYCGNPVVFTTDYPDSDPLLMTIDHIDALSAGGLNVIDNLVCSCRKCNAEKSSMTLSEFLNSKRINERSFYTIMSQYMDEYQRLEKAAGNVIDNSEVKKVNKNEGKVKNRKVRAAH